MSHSDPSDHDSRSGIPRMTDTRSDPDGDISFKWVYIVGAILVVTTIVYAILMWPLASGVADRLKAGDTPRSPLVAADSRELPPAPRLQPDPPKEIQELRQWEHRMLTSYGWADEQAGVARIPLDRAMELVLEEGLPVVPNPPTGGGN